MLRLSVFALGITLAAAAVFAPVAQAADRNVTIVNKSKTAMIAFYASNVGTNDWEEDILGQDILGSGQSVKIDMNDGSGYCRFDLKAEFEDGSEAIDENVDICTIGEVTFTD